MRFSILTLELDTPSEPADENRAEPVVRLIADSNISCVCLFGCGQHASSSPSAQAENVREGSIAEVLSRRLNSLGLKYDYIWYPSHPGAEDCECGVAILTQLPIIGHTQRSVAATSPNGDRHERSLVAARLGVSPDITMDVCSADLAGTDDPVRDRADRLIGFADDSKAGLAPEPREIPRRRGRPPRRPAPQNRPGPVRLVFLAGRFGADERGTMAGALGEAGFAYCHESLRNDPAEIAVALGGNEAVSGCDGGRDSIYLRPALRPTDGARIMAEGGRASSARQIGTLLGFEV